jgi:uncharacterized membrane protein YjgN (DUF898 family)
VERRGFSMERDSFDPEDSAGPPEHVNRSRDDESMEPGPEAGASDQINWDGDMGELFGVYIKQFLLSIVTLGIYYFWGKTQVRQYLWSHLSWNDDPFRYSGTGWELFAGFLKALVGYAVLIGLFVGSMTLFGDAIVNRDLLEGVMIIVFGALFFGLYCYAVYTARRYLLSRTEWRGIRFFQRGSGVGYATVRIAHILLTILTLGIYYPWYRHRLLDYVVNRTDFGNETFQYDGEGSDLFTGLAYYIGLWFGLPVVIGIILVALIVVVQFPFGPVVGGIYVTILPFLFIYGWFSYRAFEQRYVARNTRYRGLSFDMGHSAWDYLSLKWVNGFLIGASGGLLTPIAIHRSARFLRDHLDINGSVDFETIRQQAEEGPRHDTGEGLSEMFSRSVTLMGFFKL